MIVEFIDRFRWDLENDEYSHYLQIEGGISFISHIIHFTWNVEVFCSYIFRCHYRNMRLVIVRRRIGNILIPGVGFFTFFELWNAFNIILHIYLFIYLYARDEYILKLIHYNFVLWYYSFVRSIKKTNSKQGSLHTTLISTLTGWFIHTYILWMELEPLSFHLSFNAIL